MNCFKEYDYFTETEGDNGFINRFFNHYRLVCSIIIVMGLFSLFINSPHLWAATEVCGRIDTDTLWTKDKSPYIVTCTVSVYGDSVNPASLIIEPGVEVRFNQNQGLEIGNEMNKGALIAQGTEEEPIIFTANTDSPFPGYWARIYFYDRAVDETSIMDHCIVIWAGNSYGCGIGLYSASPTIQNSIIGLIAGHGIQCTNSSPSIVNCYIAENNNNGIHCLGISSPNIYGNTMHHNGYGLYFQSIGCDPAIINNTFSENRLYPLRISANMGYKMSGNVYINNVNQAAEVLGERISRNITCENRGVSLIILGTISVYGDTTNPVTLTIEPGVELRFNQGLGLYIGAGTHKGALIALGTEAEPIIFTANTESPVPGYWSNIYFYDGTVDEISIMDHCIVAWAGGGLSGYGIGLNSASPTIQNCIIGATAGYGIQCTNSSPWIVKNDIFYNTKGGIYCNNSSFPNIVNCIISDNAFLTPGGQGGIYCTNASAPLIINCTITRNSTSSTCGGGIRSDTPLNVINSILWDNYPGQDQICGATHTVSYSDIQGGYPGEMNINADPLFENADARDYHLQPESPCVDTGLYFDPPHVVLTEDKDGEVRPQDGNNDGVKNWDMGAYEFLSCEGGFDGDGDVDGSDLAIFAGEFGRMNCESEPVCKGDLDNDGNVDDDDLAIFVPDFGRLNCGMP
ncbi:MAG: right-handed parallel beta-helix repeat-containing protein [bacterium]